MGKDTLPPETVITDQLRVSSRDGQTAVQTQVKAYCISEYAAKPPALIAKPSKLRTESSRDYGDPKRRTCQRGVPTLQYAEEYQARDSGVDSEVDV